MHLSHRDTGIHRDICYVTLVITALQWNPTKTRKAMAFVIGYLRIPCFLLLDLISLGHYLETKSRDNYFG